MLHLFLSAKFRLRTNTKSRVNNLGKVFSCFLFLLISLSSTAQVPATPADARLKSIDQRRYAAEKSLVNHIPFKNIGPTVMSGRVTDLEVNPEDPTEFYVAYATGGLWYTSNNGQSFTPVMDSIDVLFIGDIAVHWAQSTPNNRLIWVGTGEVNSSRSSYAGIGMYKSEDGGKSWQHAGLPASQHIGKIQLHPTDKNTLWVAAMGGLYSANKERGVFKTTDGGKTWRHTLAIDSNTGVVDLDINPANPSELFAAAWYRTRSAWNFEEGGPTSGIYKSTDGGESWSKISQQGSGFPDGEGVGRIGIAVYPKNPQIVYAVLDNNFRKPDTAKKVVNDSLYVLNDFEKLTVESFAALDDKKLERFLRRNRFPAKYTAKSVKELVASGKISPNAVHQYLYDANMAMMNTPIIGCEVYRSNDGGKTWSKTNQKDLDIYSSFGYYFGKIYVSPYNPDKIHVLGIYSLLSTDGGKTFSTIDKNNVHADHHAMWMNPKRDAHIINGNDGGVNITYDDGKHWFKANTPAVGQYYAIQVDDAKPYRVYGGFQDNGTWVGPSTYRADPRWMDVGDYPYKRLGGGDGMQVEVDTRNNNTVYTGSQFGFYSRRTLTERPDLSIRPRHELGEQQLRYNWQTPILLSKHNQDIFYYGSNRVHRSFNRGDSLVAVSEDLTLGGKPGDVPYGTLTTISESPLRFGLLYAGSDDGLVHVSMDAGNTWKKISDPLPQGLWVSRVIASAHKEGRVYVTLNGYRNDHFLPYLYRSDDYGASWTLLGSDLPFEPLNVVREDPRHDSILYVGSDGGVYVSLDAGNQFMQWHSGMPRSVPVHDIAIQKRENEIVIGTHGRSLYVAKLDSVQLLLKDPSYYKSRTAALQAVSPTVNTGMLFNRSGLEVTVPTVRDRRRKR